MAVTSYDDPGAVLALESELASFGPLARTPDGGYEVEAMLGTCHVRLLHGAAGPVVQVLARSDKAVPTALAEVNRLNASVLGARLFVVDEHLLVAAELPLCALGTGELARAAHLVTKAVLVAELW